MESLYSFDVTERLGSPEYADMFNDILRFATIQVAIQLMLVMMDSERFKFFSVDFLILLIFIIVGCILYHLIVKKLVRFL